MEKNIVWSFLLLMGGSCLFGYTLFQVAARRISGQQIGTSILASLGSALVAFSFMESGKVGEGLLMAGVATLMSSSLMTATTLRRGAPKLPPSEQDRTEGPRGDRPTLDG